MEFPFNEKRATQAAAFLLAQNKGTMNYMMLVKLLYYADRTALLKRGRPITGDRMVSMKRGPVLSRILNYVRGKAQPGPYWRGLISDPDKKQFTVSLIGKAPKPDALTESEIKLLVFLYKKHGWKDPFDFSDESHDLPEWQHPGDSSIPIDPVEILKAQQVSQKDISEIETIASVDAFFSRLEKRA
jgi:hypothetical protein